MLDVTPQLVSALKTIQGADVKYEMFMDSSTSLPCITYMQIKNADTKVGDTFGYSEIAYDVTVWSKSVSEMYDYAQKVDKQLRNLGYKRTNSNELNDGTTLRLVLEYRANAIENYN